MKYIPRVLTSRFDAASLNNLPTKGEFALMKQHKFTCQCCRIICVPTKKYMSAGLEVVTINKVKHVLCILCAQSQYLERPSLSNGGNTPDSNIGVLTVYENYTQGEIIAICRDIHIARLFIANNGGRGINRAAYQAMEDVYNDFYNNVGSIQNITALGIKSQHISGYVSIYKYASPKLMENEEKVFGKVRYIPNTKAFEDVLNYWLSTSYEPIIQKLT